MAGNATVTLYYNGQLTDFELWIQNISTSSNNEFASQQLRGGISWIPIRRAQMTFNFNAMWPLISLEGSRLVKGYEDIDPNDGFAKMNKFQEAIHSHYLSVMHGSTTAPMTINYYNNSDQSLPIYNTLISQNPLASIKHDGIIQNVEKQYIRFQNAFTTQYQMLINTTNSISSSSTAIEKNKNITYAPTAADINAYGSNWININVLSSGTKSILKGL
jgi:hypothetical protein